ncbi:MAG: Imm42 family immunity protein [Polaromonas sp.]|nr:Imm42 family immunity protein [Polaromonas sp.]
MLIGDPNKFSISWHLVPEWSTQDIKNGIVMVACNGVLVGATFFPSTLGPEIIRFRKVSTILAHLKSSIVDCSQEEALFIFKSEELGSATKKPESGRTFCLLSPWGLADAGFHIFAAEQKDGTLRIFNSSADQREIKETSLPKKYISDVFEAVLHSLEGIQVSRSN